MRNAISKRPQNGTRRAQITAYFGCFVGGGMRPREPIFASPAGARWFRTFAMKQSGFAVRIQVRNQRELKGKTMRNLQKIKVVENEEHGQEYIDNHTGQNYNVK